MSYWLENRVISKSFLHFLSIWHWCIHDFFLAVLLPLLFNSFSQYLICCIFSSSLSKELFLNDTLKNDSLSSEPENNPQLECSNDSLQLPGIHFLLVSPVNVNLTKEIKQKLIPNVNRRWGLTSSCSFSGNVRRQKTIIRRTSVYKMRVLI